MKIMSVPELRAHRNLNWDRFGLFHVSELNDRVVTFETGECSATAGSGRLTRPDMGEKAGLRAGVVSTARLDILSDLIDGAPLRTPQGEEITQSGLNLTIRGASQSQEIWFDLDHRMVVGFMLTSSTLHSPSVPAHIRRRGGVYYTGPKAKPRGNTIRYTSPTKYTTEERAHLRQLRAACKAWARMKELYVPEHKDYWLTADQRTALDNICGGSAVRYTHWSTQPKELGTYLKQSFNDLTPQDRWRLIAFKTINQRTEERLPYLTW